MGLGERFLGLLEELVGASADLNSGLKAAANRQRQPQPQRNAQRGCGGHYASADPVLRRLERAVSNCAGAKGFEMRILFGTPCAVHSSPE
jgi:hypothetical protein